MSVHIFLNIISEERYKELEKVAGWGECYFHTMTGEDFSIALADYNVIEKEDFLLINELHNTPYVQKQETVKSLVDKYCDTKEKEEFRQQIFDLDSHPLILVYCE